MPSPSPEACPPRSRLRHAWAWAGLWALLAVPVQAQDQVFSADMVGKPAVPFDGEPLPELNPVLVVTAFEQGCLLAEGRVGTTLDWATANDFEPADPADPSVAGMLGGQPGTVLVAPETAGRVMLAVSEGQCSVWAERTPGPPLRAALAGLVDSLVTSGKGHTAQLRLDRSAEAAGAWRNQMEWRYRAGGTSRDWSVGVATTLGNGPGTQVLHMAPLAAEPPAVAAPH